MKRPEDSDSKVRYNYTMTQVFRLLMTVFLSFFASVKPAPVATVFVPTQTPIPTQSSVPTPTPTPTPSEPGIRVPILLYHYISENPNKTDIARYGLSTPPTVFASQLQTLKDAGYTAITLDEMAAAVFNGGPLPAKPIVLTFDDGYEDFYQNAYPLLTKYQMKGTEFIPTGLIGTNASFYMTWGQIEEMSKSPFVTFASHSVSHAYLTTLTQSDLTKEVEESKRVLESHVGYRINWFAYPYGAFDARVVAAARTAGYIGAATTLPGVWQYRSRFFSLTRYRAGTRTGEGLLSLLQ